MCKKTRKVFLFLLIVINIFIAGFIYTRIVEATGGAFPYTKMGGADVDDEAASQGSWVGGVNRSINDGSPWGLGSNAVPEYNAYESGECNHCHEIHGSFGGSEPRPNTQGDSPAPFMTFMDAQVDQAGADFCLYCHDQFDFGPISGLAAGDPPQGFGVHGVFQNGSGNVFKNSSHGSKSSFLWPKPNNGLSENATIHPRKTRSTGKRTCLNCHTPHGIMGKSGAAYDTAAVPENVQAKPANHPITNEPLSGDITTAYLIPRHKIAWEEALCENCHDADGTAAGTAPNIKDEINKRSAYTGETCPDCGGGSGHPVDYIGFSGQHSTKEAVEVTVKHVECYDCHNPHGVKDPTGGLGDGDGGRIVGVKYVDINGNKNIGGVGDARQPYVYELCFRCHGETHNTFIPNQTATGTGSEVGGTLRTTVAQYGCGAPEPASECTDGSNKRLEFDPTTTSTTGLGSTFSDNRAYHPVAVPGRNPSAALTNHLLGGLSPAKTINCTDCHNNNILGTGTISLYTPKNEEANNFFAPTYPGPITQSNLRSTDVNNGYTQSPVGPHGSTNVRLLRANYNTTLGSAGPGGFPPFSSWDPTNFQLCFNCHDSRAFIDDDGCVNINNPDNTACDKPGALVFTNFRQTGQACMSKKRNLHATHLTDGASSGAWNLVNGVHTACANCHYNVHSNAEATNTLYGDGAGGALPPTGNTHLINFSPIILPNNYAKPRWWYAPEGAKLLIRCDLMCHDGATMGTSQAGMEVDAVYAWIDS